MLGRSGTRRRGPRKRRPAEARRRWDRAPQAPSAFCARLYASPRRLADAPPGPGLSEEAPHSRIAVDWNCGEAPPGPPANAPAPRHGTMMGLPDEGPGPAGPVAACPAGPVSAGPANAPGYAAQSYSLFSGGAREGAQHSEPRFAEDSAHEYVDWVADVIASHGGMMTSANLGSYLVADDACRYATIKAAFGGCVRLCSRDDGLAPAQ
ncbi:hypothetical protein M885DRAFT_270581 [Pelagophyceae sp. CCMP2097]|nr:hypothetical protein M885DRAFT_270581 [Pelagophyceae sp. CCMP2097]